MPPSPLLRQLLHQLVNDATRVIPGDCERLRTIARDRARLRKTVFMGLVQLDIDRLRCSLVQAIYSQME
jgi:hypothetical protein